MAVRYDVRWLVLVLQKGPGGWELVRHSPKSQSVDCRRGEITRGYERSSNPYLCAEDLHNGSERRP